MKFKKIILLIILLLPCCVFASSEGEVVARTVKYYRTVTVINVSPVTYNVNPEVTSFTTEISEEEYNAVDPNIEEIPAVNTEYKRIEAQIVKVSSHYQYKTDLTWKKLPKVRSNDIIAIGHTPYVDMDGTYVFGCKRCYSDGKCITNSAHTRVASSTGTAAIFMMPTDTDITLSAYIYGDVVKVNPNQTITEQVATADYAHAVKTVPMSIAKKFYTNIGGIYLDDEAEDYFDDMPAISAVYSGTW